MKKLIVIALIFLISAYLLIAAGAQEKVEVVSLSMWTAPLAGTPAEEEFYSDMASRFFKETSIKLDVTFIPWADIYTKYQTSAAAGVLPDLLFMPPDWGIKLAHGGHLIPVTDVLEKLGGSEAFFSPQWHYYNNQYWALAAVRNPRICHYRKDLLAEVGYNHAPRNWVELEDVAKKLTGNGRWGTAFFYGTATFAADQCVVVHIKQSGGGILSEDGKVIFNNPETRRAYEFYTDLYLNGYNPEGAIGWSHSQDAIDFLKAGKAGMTILGIGSAVAIKNQLTPELFEKFGFAPLWEGPGGKGSFGANDGWAISSYSEHPDEAKKFIEFFFKQDNLVDWFKLIAMLPPIKSMTENREIQDFFKEFGFWDAGIAMLPHTIRYDFPHYGTTLAASEIEGNHILAEVTTEIVTGKRSVADAVSRAHRRIEEIHAKYR